MTKKSVFWSSLMMGVLGYVLASPLEFGFCKETYTFGDRIGCLDKVVPMLGEIIILLTIPTFLLSLITYWMHEKVFRAWLRFAYWWIPLTIVLVLMTHDSSGGFGISDIVTREAVSMIFSALFLLISLVLIIWKALGIMDRKTQKK